MRSHPSGYKYVLLWVENITIDSSIRAGQRLKAEISGFNDKFTEKLAKSGFMFKANFGTIVADEADHA
eukprot:g3935.t1